MRPTVFVLPGFLLFLLAGCGFRQDPEYESVDYTVTGNAAGVTISAVVDEWGTLYTATVGGLPWSADYTNNGPVAEPPVYLRVELTPSGTPLAAGSADSDSLDHLVDTGANFAAAGVAAGDVARNTGSGAISLVTAVSATDLTLTAGDDPFPLGTEGYEVYRMTRVTATVTGDGAVIARQTLSGWEANLLEATVICENYTAP